MKKPEPKDFNLPYEQSEYNIAIEEYIKYLENIIDNKLHKTNKGTELRQ